MYFDFSVASIFLFSLSESRSSLLKTRISFAFVLYMCFSASLICSSLSTTSNNVSVEFTRDFSWPGNDGMSMIWIGASSCLNVPSCGLYVVNGCGEIFGFSFVRVLNIVDFPTFGNPAKMHCMSAFLIPCCEDFPDLFCLANPALSFL